MNIIYPKRLQPGDHIRVIAPSLSMSIISEETKNYAIERFKQMGFSISFEQNISEVDIFSSRSIEMRVNGLHEAFKDKSVNAVLAVIGGFNANQLLEYVDWELIKQNPKIFCGYSDITILNNAIFSQTGLINYYGPAFSTFGQKILDQYEIDYFLKILSNNQSFSIQPSSKWSNDQWYLDQNSLF